MNQSTDPNQLTVPNQPTVPNQVTDPFLESGPIAAWAGSHGLDAHTGLALAACTLAHLAGQSLMFQDGNGLSGMPPPSFIGLETDLALRSALASITGPLMAVQQALVLKARDFTPADLEAAMTECNRIRSRPLEELDNSVGSTTGTHEQLGRDLRVSARSVRYESLTRPRMVMEDSPPADLGQALASYHFGHAYLAGGVERLPNDERRRNQRLDQLASFVQGVEIGNSPKSLFPNERVNASLRGILLFPESQFDGLLETRRDFLSLFLPIGSDPSARLPARVDPVEAATFEHMVSREAQRLIACRRSLAAADASIVDPEALSIYLGLRRDYLGECSALPVELRTTAILGLPDLLAWTLIRLSRGDLDGEWVCAQAFASARHLRNRAMRIFRAKDDAREAAKRKLRAERLIRRLLRVGPCRRRKLVRGSDDMRSLVNEPVIRVLIQIGVFVETEDKILTIGRVPTESLPPTLFIETPAQP